MMTTHVRCRILPSTYRDSVVLMVLSRELENLPGVQQAAAMMAAPQNKALLREAGLLTAAGAAAGADDLVLCVRAETLPDAERALETGEQRLTHRQARLEACGEAPPRTLETALRRLPEASLACISVPGQYAAAEARKAIQHGLHVFLFSDHVPLEAELELKQLAARQGVLVMGPDCGTAILNGVPLGFANQLPRGPVGLIAASGTGLQHVTCLLAQHGLGISQAIGVGGRDLHRRIGAQSMRVALRALADDSGTRVIVLLSKPPDVEVAASLSREAASLGKPCVLALLGAADWPVVGASLYPVATLEGAARAAMALVRAAPVPAEVLALPSHLATAVQTARAVLQHEQRRVCGLYAGGTLAYEALWLLRHMLGPVESNLDDTYEAAKPGANLVLDLGAEAFTGGRPHPMIDPAARRQFMLEQSQRSDVAVMVCDVVLGWGAHADPAAALAETWQEVQEQMRRTQRSLLGIAVVCGAADDPQGYAHQRQVLQESGLWLAESNAQAVLWAAAVVGGPASVTLTPAAASRRHSGSVDAGAPVAAPNQAARLREVFASGPRVINLGLERFAEQLRACAVPVVHVDWRPPAGGDARLAALLERVR